MEEKQIDQAFVYRSYPKDELAQMYLPGYARATAVKKFNSWIKKSPQLQDELKHSGVSIRTRIYSTIHVRQIVEHLGEP